MDSTSSEIDFACPHCGQQYSVDPSMIGHSTRCQTCGKIMMISVPGRPKSAPRPPSSQLNGTTASSSGKKGFSKRDFALGAITTAAVFIVGIWMYQKGIIKITTANKPVPAPIVGAATPPSPKPVTAVSPMATKPSTPVPEKSEPGDALYKEAMRYYNGGDVLQDYTKAVELLIKASEKGSPEADGQLAFIYWNGAASQPADEAKAVSYAQKAGNRKTQLAHQTLGSSFLFGVENVQQQDFKAAYSEFMKANDYYYSQFLVGLMRYHGVGTNEDKKGAAEQFFSMCKNRPNVRQAGMAAMCLGYMYVKGEGVGKNVGEGVSWMKWGVKVSGRNIVDLNSGGYRGYVMYAGLRGFHGISDVWPGKMDLLDKAMQHYYDVVVW